MTSNWIDDLETTEIQYLLVSVKNKEKELKLIEERKMIEDADIALVEDLFNKKISIKDLGPVKGELKESKECKNIIGKEMQKKTKTKPDRKKKQDKNLQDIYDETELDEYDELYRDIEDKYIFSGKQLKDK